MARPTFRSMTFSQQSVHAEKLRGMPNWQLIAECGVSPDQPVGGPCFGRPARGRSQRRRSGRRSLAPLANIAKPSDLDSAGSLALVDGVDRPRDSEPQSNQPAAAANDLDDAESVAKRIVERDQEYNNAQFQLACIHNRHGELLGRNRPVSRRRSRNTNARPKCWRN